MSSEELFSFIVHEPLIQQQSFNVMFACKIITIVNWFFTYQRNHTVYEGNILIFQALHVTYNIGLWMITELKEIYTQLLYRNTYI